MEHSDKYAIPTSFQQQWWVIFFTAEYCIEIFPQFIYLLAINENNLRGHKTYYLIYEIGS